MLKNLHAIAAMAKNRVIGNGPNIPWHLPEDFKFFKKTTMGGVLLMGRKTFDSIGKPLPGRETWVISRTSLTIPNVRVLSSIDDAIKAIKEDGREVWLSGGADIYQQLLPHCCELILTEVAQEPNGDVMFPLFEDTFTPVETILETSYFIIKRWKPII